MIDALISGKLIRDCELKTSASGNVCQCEQFSTPTNRA